MATHNRNKAVYLAHRNGTAEWRRGVREREAQSSVAEEG